MRVQAKLTEVVSISSWIPSSGTVTFVGVAIAAIRRASAGRRTQRAAGAQTLPLLVDRNHARRRAAAHR